MLELSGVNVHYGKIHVLRDVSLRVETGEVAALIGPNAAGKTTTLRALVGLKDWSEGLRERRHSFRDAADPTTFNARPHPAGDRVGPRGQAGFPQVLGS